MKKIVLLLSLLFLSTLFAETDFKHCVKKTRKSFVDIGYGQGLAVGEHEVFFYSKKPLQDSRIIKSDPFQGFYLFKVEQRLEPLELWNESDKAYRDELASISPSNQYKGYVEGKGALLEHYARFSGDTEENSAIVGICYALFGIGMGDGEFLELHYIRRFLYGDSSYKDIGIRIYKNKQIPIVEFIDPFVNYGVFERGDKIVGIADKKIEDIRDFTDAVDALKIGASTKVVIDRNGKKYEKSVRIMQRLGGGLIADSALNRAALRIDKEYVVTGIRPTSSELRWLKPGDMIKEINRVSTKGMDLREFLTKLDEPYLRFLVRRGEFDFFIKIDLE